MIIVNFLDTLDQAPDSVCVGQMLSMAFVTDDYSTPGFSRLLLVLIQALSRPIFLTLFLPMGPFLVISLWRAGDLLEPVIRLWKPRQQPIPRYTKVFDGLWWGSMLLHTVFDLGLVLFILNNAHSASDVIRLLTVHSAAAPWFVVSWLASLWNAGLLAFAVLAWVKQFETHGERRYYLLAALSAVALSLSLSYWGLLGI